MQPLRVVHNIYGPCGKCSLCSLASKPYFPCAHARLISGQKIMSSFHAAGICAWESGAQQSCDNNTCCVTLFTFTQRFIVDRKTRTQCAVVGHEMMQQEQIEEAIGAAVTALGYLELRPKQMEAVQRFISGKCVFISLPTGSGKTLCFYLLLLVFEFFLS